MKVLITMAGKGSRFRETGVTVPKHEIEVGGRPMFDWAMRSLSAFFDEEFVFVTQSDHSAEDFLAEACGRVGIDEYATVPLHEYTDGQATTAVKADDLIDGDEGVAIYNIDTYIEEHHLTPSDITGSGFIPTFEPSGDRWSFVKHDDSGNVIKVSEKERISEQATVGFYYFDRWEDFTESYDSYGQHVKEKYGEKYVAPLYNHLIEMGRTVRSHEIDRDAVHVLGTPEDLRQFKEKYNIN